VGGDPAAVVLTAGMRADGLAPVATGFDDGIRLPLCAAALARRNVLNALGAGGPAVLVLVAASLFEASSR